MSPGDAVGGEGFDAAYLVLSGTTTAARCPELLRGLVGLGFSTVIAIPTPNASRVIAPCDLADVEGVQVVESYFDLAIRPRPPRGVVLFAPCSFNSLNKLAHGSQPRGGTGDAPTDPGLLDHRGERLFRALAGFEKRREIAALPQLRNGPGLIF